MATHRIDRQVQRSWLIKIIKTGRDQGGGISMCGHFLLMGKRWGDVGLGRGHWFTLWQQGGLRAWQGYGEESLIAVGERVGRGVGSRSHPQGLSLAPTVGTSKPSVPQQLPCPTLKTLVPPHLSTWDGVNKSHLTGFINSNGHIFSADKGSSFLNDKPLASVLSYHFLFTY